MGCIGSLPRCNATAKSTGKQCRQVAMANGKCYIHGGKSTGPRTAEGRERISKAKTKHGFYSKAAIEERRNARALLRSGKELIKQCTC